MSLKSWILNAWDNLVDDRQTPHQQRVEDFMKRGQQTVPNHPMFPSDTIRLLRARLVIEEALELVEELGVTLRVIVDGPQREKDVIIDNAAEVHLSFDRLKFDADKVDPSFDQLGKIAKEAADLSVVTIGTLSAFGIKDKPVLEAVDQNNLEKFGPGGYRNNDGKWIKPPGHHKPDMVALIIEQLVDPVSDTK